MELHIREILSQSQEFHTTLHMGEVRFVIPLEHIFYSSRFHIPSDFMTLSSRQSIVHEESIQNYR